MFCVWANRDCGDYYKTGIFFDEKLNSREVAYFLMNRLVEDCQEEACCFDENCSPNIEEFSKHEGFERATIEITAHNYGMGEPKDCTLSFYICLEEE